MLIAWLAAALLPSRMPPVDECRGDPPFDRFRATLTRAVAAHDAEAIAPLASDGVRLSFGGRRGRDLFLQILKRGDGETDRLWKALGETLALGCAVKGEARVFPSMFVQGDDLDGFTTWVARPGARLRTAPRTNAPVRARLSWDVLIDDETTNGGHWIRVRTARGLRGYIHRSAARSLIDYRLLASRQGGEWKITAFVAGD